MRIQAKEIRIGDRMAASGNQVKAIEKGLGSVLRVTLATSKGNKIVNYHNIEWVRIADRSKP